MSRFTWWERTPGFELQEASECLVLAAAGVSQALRIPPFVHLDGHYYWWERTPGFELQEASECLVLAAAADKGGNRFE
jgi:hypothetical protein